MDKTEIVNAMIARLRELQGTGEYVPLARKVTAGAGLEGGGALGGDVSLALTKPVLDAVSKVNSTTWLVASDVSVGVVNNSVVRRDAAGAVSVGTATKPEHAVSLKALQDATSRAVTSAVGTGKLQISVEPESTHVTSSEVPGVLYILTRG